MKRPKTKKYSKILKRLIANSKKLIGSEYHECNPNENPGEYNSPPLFRAGARPKPFEKQLYHTYKTKKVTGWIQADSKGNFNNNFLIIYPTKGDAIDRVTFSDVSFVKVIISPLTKSPKKRPNPTQ